MRVRLTDGTWFTAAGLELASILDIYDNDLLKSWFWQSITGTDAQMWVGMTFTVDVSIVQPRTSAQSAFIAFCGIRTTYSRCGRWLRCRWNAFSLLNCILLAAICRNATDTWTDIVLCPILFTKDTRCDKCCDERKYLNASDCPAEQTPQTLRVYAKNKSCNLQEYEHEFIVH